MTLCVQNGIDPVFICDPNYLKDLDFTQFSCQYNPAISPQNPGESLIMRPLSLDDFDKGFLQLLTHLTKVGDISREQFSDGFNSMKACPNTYFVIVIEDTRSNEVIGAATLFIEQKFIHQVATRGRIEDVVVSDKYRGKQLGKLLVDTLVLLSKRVGCYKLTLDCKDKMVPFYEQFGFSIEKGNNNSMAIRFRD